MFLQRFNQYQKERFPLLQHGLLITAFGFSALSYSLLCRNKDFISAGHFIAGILILIGIFYLLRVFDEHKDAEEDKQNRSHLPVPRGLVSLQELRWTAYITIGFQALLLLFFFPKMIVLYLLVMAYMWLMGKEFFVAEWLKKRPFIYAASHMLIIPLADIFAGGIDWYLADGEMPEQMMYFFILSFFNGIVLEIGRKLKVPDNEEVNSYSFAYGARPAAVFWLSMLILTWILSLVTIYVAKLPLFYVLGLSLFLPVGVFAVRNYLKDRTVRSSKFLENLSGLWTLSMYLCVGGIPMLVQIFTK